MQCSTSELQSSSNTANLFARAQAGDQDAWASLFNQCYEKVRRVVGRRLNSRLRRFVDSSDITNDVLTELYAKAARFQFASIDEVRTFLIDTAYKRVIDEDRRRRSKKRNTDRERPIPDQANGHEAWMLSSGDPTPSEIAVANETGQKLHDAVDEDDDAGHLVVTRRLESYDNNEIANETGWPIWKIQRFLKNLRKSIN